MTTLLVVDDLAQHRALAGGVLARESGWRVVFAANGQEALTQLAAQPVDLVLTDLMMPQMNGLELLRAVRRDFPKIPVVLMTASGSEDIAVQALQEGAASYVPKRGLARKLVKTVDTVLLASDEQRLHSVVGRHLTSQEFTFVLENDLSLLLGVPVYLKPHLLADGRMDNLTRLRMHVALEEALVNALYHGNLELSKELREKGGSEYARMAELRSKESPYRERRIHVRVRFTTEEALVTIRDEGPGFDPKSLPDPTDAAHLDREHGRGVALMRAFMDAVEYNNKGNEVTMRKRTQAAPVQASSPEVSPSNRA